MSTQQADITSLIRFDVTDATIARIQKEYLCLTVKDPNDKVGYAECDTARKEVKALRVSVEKRRTELKEDSLRFGQRVDAEAKKLRLQLEAVEVHLQGQQRIVDDEKERVRLEAERLEAQKFQARLSALQDCNAKYDINRVREMLDDEFVDFVLAAEKAHAAELERQAQERKRIAELEAEQKAQAERLRAQEQEAQKLRDELLAKQRAELAEQHRKLAEERAAADAERRKTEQAEAALRAEKQRAIDEAARVEAARASAELQRQAAESAERGRLEREAAKKIADKKLFDSIKTNFPTLESAWIEIARLMKVAGAL